MRELVDEPVSVALVSSPTRRHNAPWKVRWRGEVWFVRVTAFAHYKKESERLMHVFDVVAKNSRHADVHMRLRFDTFTLDWTLEAVSDGQAE